MDAPFRIELFSGLRVQQQDRIITRFQTQKTGGLLAYLAFHRDREHSREQITDLLWPETSREAGRNRLKQAIASLRRQLEPPGTSRAASLSPKADPAYN